MISVRNLTKIYKLNKKDKSKNVVALNSINLDFPDKGLVFLLGKSGSGKSTLLNAIGGLDTFDDGEIIIKGKSSKNFKQSDFDSYRNTFIGFIFQEYNILEEFSVGKNLSLALELQGKKPHKSDVEKLLEEVDLKGYYKRKPNQLSGGQKQRVAIARALIKDPEIIMADEPTGALDSATGKQVMDTLKKLSKTKLVIIVSHDREFAEIYGDRIIELKDGQIIRDEVKHEVPSVKAAPGISFIDNKIIYIEKGQPISKENLMQINRILISRSSKSDTIISFDSKSNESVKKSAFITENGNCESFKTTEREDIKQTPCNPNDFKMIKSKLKFKDSLKIGSSSLKHKPIRLIFTILLSVIALTMFGIVNTFTNYNQAESTYQTIKSLDLKTLAINNYLDYNEYPLTQSLYNELKTENNNYTFYKVIGTGQGIDIENSNYTFNQATSYTTNRLASSGIMALTSQVQQDFNLQILYGNLPVDEIEVGSERHQNRQICITENLFNSIVLAYNDINSFNDIKDRTLSSYINNQWQYFKIVGVIKDNNINIDKYKTLTGESSSVNKNRAKYEELDVIMKYSLINMCYTTETVFNNLSLNYKPQHSNYTIFETNDNIYNYTIDFTNCNKIEDFVVENYIHYLKAGINPKTLSENQVIVPRDLLNSFFGISDSDILKELNKGITIKIATGYNYSKNHFLTLQVVGCHDYGGSLFVSNEIYKNSICGSDYVITKLKNNSTDKSLIKFCSNHNKNGSNLTIQFQSTPVLVTFGDLILTLSESLQYVAIGLAVFAGLMLMNFISTSIVYKKREIGVLRAIGARGKDVFSIFFCESMIICLINFLLSASASGIICSIINNVFATKLGITLTLLVFGLKQIMLIFGIAVIVAFVSSFIPVNKLARKNPIDSINNR